MATKRNFRVIITIWLWWKKTVNRLPQWLFATEPKSVRSNPKPLDLIQGQLRDLKPQKSENFSEKENNHTAYQDDNISIFQRKLSHNITRISYILVSTSLFCVITLTGSHDADLLTSGAEVRLPLLNYGMGFGAFLLVGPILLIALAVYLHIFVARHRLFQIDLDNKDSMMLNFDDWPSRMMVLIVLYWLVPATLAVFAWKAWPQPLLPQPMASLLLVYVTLVVSAGSAVLQFRRCPRLWRAWALPSLVIVYASFNIGFIAIIASRELNLFHADLSGKDLRSTNLSGAYLKNADLSNSNLSAVNLSESVLSGADLSGANLSDANLFRAVLDRADLSNINLSDARLHNSNLFDANFYRACFYQASLDEADLTGANLLEADLSSADLSKARNLEPDGACGDENTRLPGGLTISRCVLKQCGPLRNTSQ